MRLFALILPFLFTCAFAQLNKVAIQSNLRFAHSTGTYYDLELNMPTSKGGYVSFAYSRWLSNQIIGGQSRFDHGFTRGNNAALSYGGFWVGGKKRLGKKQGSGSFVFDRKAFYGTGQLGFRRRTVPVTRDQHYTNKVVVSTRLGVTYLQKLNPRWAFTAETTGGVYWNVQMPELTFAGGIRYMLLTDVGGTPKW